MKTYVIVYKSSYGFQVEQAVEAYGIQQAKNILKTYNNDIKKILEVRES